MQNQDIRRAAAGAGVKLWQVAEALGIADTTFCRKLRHELPQEEKERGGGRKWLNRRAW